MSENLLSFEIYLIMFKELAKYKLKILAKLIIWRHKPVIIGITGSVGKTGTKLAIASVLKTKYSVRASVGSYNNEFGLPFTIIGSAAPGKNIFKWIMVGIKFCVSFFSKNYPKVLILEMGADRPGDIAYLVSIAKPDIAIVTRVGSVHMEYFDGPDGLQREKSTIIHFLGKEGIAILNSDDARVMAMKELHSGKILTYGLGEQADVQGVDMKIYQYTDANLHDLTESLGMKFEVIHDDWQMPVNAKGLLGRPNLYSILAAFTVGRIFNIPPKNIANVFLKYELPPGRLRPLSGIKNAIILDDSYNSSPEAAEESLRVLREIKGKRRIAVLGDMLELGPTTEMLHRKIGRSVNDLRIDLLITVGRRAAFIADEARNRGFAKTRIKEYETSDDARLPLQRGLSEGDVVLVKGSQGMRMERIVKEIMAEPERAGDLLCRQDATWAKK